MRPETLQILFGLFWPPAWALICRAALRVSGRRQRAERFWAQWFYGGFGVILGAASVLDIAELCIGIAQALLAAFLWWLSRRKRKRAPKAFGAKSRALVAAIARKAREALKPKPALRPVPGGAS